MKFFKQYPASNAQKGIVREFQLLHIVWDDKDVLPPPFITCLANTEQGLYFYPRDNVKVLETPHSEGITADPAVITGPKNKPVGLSFGRDYLMLKASFHPTGLFRLLRMPMQKTVNTGINALDFFNAEVEQVLNELRSTNSYDQMIETVSSFIDTQIQKGILPEEPVDEVAIKMLDPFARYSLPEWASMACLSLRQFERVFTKRVGISPKMYTRIVRFENAMKLKNQFPEKNWSEIAFECEYDDSSHLLREFRQFADFPPGSLLQKQTSGHGDFPTG